MTTESEVVIRATNVSKFIQTKPIVYRLNLEVPKGTLFGLLGPNGAGKSTTLKLITGRLRLTSGKINVLGMDSWKQRKDIAKKIGYLPQSPTQPPDKTVIRFMELMCRLRGFSKSDALNHSRELLNEVGLGRYENQNVGKLSGGEKQRLGFANALIGDPEILILDEPTASLDPEGRIYVMNLITQYARNRQKTIIISSHILPEIQRMTNYIAILANGKVLTAGPVWKLTNEVYDSNYEIHCSEPEKLITELANLGYDTELENSIIFVRNVSNLSEFWSTVPRLCSENHWELKFLKPVHDALERVFLNYVSNPLLVEEQL